MRTFALATLILTSTLAAAQTPFCTQLQSAIQDSPAHWGISVTSPDGTPLCAINAAQFFRPASNAKLFTTAAALALLGPDKTFTTSITGFLDPTTGAITGDLTLNGAGDANLDSADLPFVQTSAPHPPLAFHDLEDLVAQLTAKGVKSVTGDIIGDDTLFPSEPYAFGVELNDLPFGFGAPVSALSIADNQLRITIAPGQLPGAPATVAIDQQGIPYYLVDSEVTTSDPKGPRLGFEIDRLPGSHTVRVAGSIPAATQSVNGSLAIDDPAAFAAQALRSLLIAHGISVTGIARARHKPSNESASFLSRLRAPDDAEQSVLNGAPQNSTCPSSTTSPTPTLATHISASISADILFTNKVSQNLHAELLLHQLGRLVPCGSGSTVAGARMVRAFLLRAGLSPDDVILYDGSGLSDHDLVTPRSITQLLVYASKQTWFAAWKASFPIGGIDGSLASRFTSSDQPALKGKVIAKTGTLGETRALSGFLTANSGNTLIFSILVDNHPPASNEDRTLADQLVEMIAASN